MNKINSSDSVEIKKSHELEKEIHLRKAQWIYTDLEEKNLQKRDLR